MRNVMVLLGLLVCFAVGANAYILQFKDTAGMTRTYQSSMTMKGQVATPGQPTVPMNMTMTFTMTEKIVKVNANGTATIESALKDGKITMTVNGEQQQIPYPAFTMTYDRTPLGKVSNIKMDGEGAAMMQQAGMPSMNNMLSGIGAAVMWPDKDLAIGDTWEMPAISPEILPGAKMTMSATFKLDDVKVIGGKNYLIVRSNTSMEMPKQTITLGNTGKSMQMSMQMTALGASSFDEAAGALFGSSINARMKNDVVVDTPQGGKVTVSTTLEMTGTVKLVKTENAP